jgi:hypothetical protein
LAPSSVISPYFAVASAKAYKAPSYCLSFNGFIMLSANKLIDPINGANNGLIIAALMVAPNPIP